MSETNDEPLTAIKLTFSWHQEYTCLVNVPSAKLEEYRDRPGDLKDWLQEEYRDHTSGTVETISYELEAYEEMDFKWTPKEKIE